MRENIGKVKRFDNGIYFLPKKTIFKSGSQLAPEKVLECKYLRDKDERCGYVSGLMFFNQMGLTTQVPMMYEVVSNKATNDYRETSLAKSRVIVRKPKVPVTEKNYKALQFLDIHKGTLDRPPGKQQKSGVELGAAGAGQCERGRSSG